MRSFLATHNLLAVSASMMESAINTERTLDTTMLCDLSDMRNIDPRRSDNSNQANGKEEADLIYDNGNTASFPMNFSMAQPQHLAFLFSYAFGKSAPAAAGTGYQHTITPIVGDLDYSRSNPSFSAGDRLGLSIVKRLYASCFVDSLTLTFKSDDWVKITSQIKATGKMSRTITTETISAQKNAVSLTLATNAVHGADAQTRLDNVHQIKAELATGVWTEVAYSAVSSATPAEITITAPSGTSGAVNYKVTYVPTEPAWATFPARITENPLKVSQLVVNFGGAWNGTTFEGGRSMSSEIKSIEYSLNNNGEISFTPGAGGSYGSRYLRGGRVQKVKLDREMREYIMQQHLHDNDTFGIYMLAEGDVFSSPHKYQAELILPQCGILSVPISVDGKRLAEAGEILVMENTTYGSAIMRVKNLQTKYASAS